MLYLAHLVSKSNSVHSGRDSHRSTDRRDKLRRNTKPTMATLLGRLPLATRLGRLSLMLLLALSHALTIPTTLRAHRGNNRIERVRAYW